MLCLSVCSGFVFVGSARTLETVTVEFTTLEVLATMDGVAWVAAVFLVPPVMLNAGYHRSLFTVN
jgi:hypothetical protein